MKRDVCSNPLVSVDSTGGIKFNLVLCFSQKVWGTNPNPFLPLNNKQQEADNLTPIPELVTPKMEPVLGKGVFSGPQT